ncbi:hypothetical protein PSYMO_38348, partial [Pseudomonas amygdali pv. mori str. 301020]
MIWEGDVPPGFEVLVAPVTGYVAKRSVQLGQRIQ